MMGQLGDYLEILGGGTPSRDVDAYWNGDLPWATVKDLTTKRISETYESITTRGAAECATNVVPENTLLISTRMALGRMSITEVPMAFNQDLKALKIIGPVDQDYLYHFLSSKEAYFKSRGNGATVKGFKVEDIRSIPFDPPPLPTQRRIAAVLDKAQALVANDRQTLALYDQLAKSLFLEMFGDPVRNERGWEVVKLEDICGVASSRRVFVEELVDSGIPFYRGTEIGMLGEGIDVDPSLFITEEHYARLQEHSGIPKPGDLLLPSICPNGRIYIVPDHSPFYFKDGRVLWVQVDDSKVSSAYLRSTLQSLFSVNYSKIASGTTFAELKIVALKKLMLPLPPVKSQQAFEVAINKVNGQRTRAEKSLRQSEGLFGSLLQEAFSGVLGGLTTTAR